MTREETIRMFRREIECLSHTKCKDCILEKVCDPMQTPTDDKYIEVYAMAIKALEQEPCEDCISRAELLKAIDTWDKFGFEHTGCFVREPKDDFITYVHYDDVIKCIKGLPSVQPKAEQEPKTDIIDKIREDIHGTAVMKPDGEWYLNEKWIMRIIDKYKEG